MSRSGEREQRQVHRLVRSVRRRRAGALAIVLAITLVGVVMPPAANAGVDADLNCADWLGHPVSGSPEWNEADLNNQRCATEGRRMLLESPAVTAAKAANSAAGEGDFGGDPFRAPNRWANTRGRYEQITYTDRDGNIWPAALFGPRDTERGPYPGVLLVCHACFPRPLTTENVALWYWAAETLAEAGYVVMYAAVGGNSVPRTIDATDFLVSTATSPMPRGNFNPWYEQVDRNRLGIVGHSGAAGVALNVGNSDPRFDAIVAWDPAASASLSGVTPRIPTMIQVADYTLRDGPVPRAEKPVATPESKYTFFDAFRTAGVDVMQVAPRATTHLDWTRFAGANPFGATLDHGVYGETVGAYYTLAWLDRYVASASDAGSRSQKAARASKAAARRLTANGTDRFDRSADRYSIGTGFFDPDRESKGKTAEAGNVPVEIGGVRIRNLLSFQYPSRYSLGARQCDDMRAGCTR
jgi:dienelactone hydrolase